MKINSIQLNDQQISPVDQIQVSNEQIQMYADQLVMKRSFKQNKKSCFDCNYKNLILLLVIILAIVIYFENVSLKLSSFIQGETVKFNKHDLSNSIQQNQNHIAQQTKQLHILQRQSKKFNQDRIFKLLKQTSNSNKNAQRQIVSSNLIQTDKISDQLKKNHLKEFLGKDIKLLLPDNTKIEYKQNQLIVNEKTLNPANKAYKQKLFASIQAQDKVLTAILPISQGLHIQNTKKTEVQINKGTNPSALIIQDLVNDAMVNDQLQVQIQANYPLPQQYTQLECNQRFEKNMKQKGQLYDVRPTHEQFRVNSNIASYTDSLGGTYLTKAQYSRALDLMQLIHRIGPDGKFNKNDYCQDKRVQMDLITKSMKEEKQQWNQKYQMDSYFKRQLRFCIVVNSYRNAQNGLMYRNIDSILQQNYTNYHVVYTDDFSPDQTGQKTVEYLNERGIPSDKFRVKQNTQHVGMMANIYNGIASDCQLGEIAVMLDGDDSFIGTNVLAMLNAVYQKEKIAIMWANFIIITANSIANPGFSRDYNQYEKEQGRMRATQGFITSHLKTFFVDLFMNIPIEQLKDYDGTFFGGASDVAIMMPMIQMANPKMKYLPELVYQYRYDTGQVGMTVNRIPQRAALNKIYQTKPLTQLKDFSFIDKSIENALQIKL